LSAESTTYYCSQVSKTLKHIQFQKIIITFQEFSQLWTTF